MANRHRAIDILRNQLHIEVGGDVNQFKRWDPNQTGHGHLRIQLGDRVTNIAPLRLLWTKKLKASDVSSQQTRFVLPRKVMENVIVRCLTIQQRDELCNNGAEIQVAAFDEHGDERVLKLKKRMQAGHDSGTYVLIGDWTKMVDANEWKEGDTIKIWGLPYARSDITFVFTTTV